MKQLFKWLCLFLSMTLMLDFVACSDDNDDNPAQTPTYAIKKADGIANGSVVVDRSSATAGDTVTITATPDIGYELYQLTVKNSSDVEIPLSKETTTENTVGKFVMPKSAVTVTAVFSTIGEHKITIDEDIAHGSVVAAPVNASADVSVTLTATADDDYEFYAYIVKDAAGKEVAVEDNVFTMPNSDVTVSVVFVIKGSHRINISPNSITNGTVSVDRTTALAGESVTLTPIAAEGYELSAYSVKDAADKEVSVEDNVFTMPNSDVTVSAVFRPIGKFNVNILQSQYGLVASDSNSVVAGENVKLTIAPMTNFKLYSISVKDADGNDVSVDYNYRFTMPESNVTVSALFIPQAARDITIATDIQNGSVESDREYAVASDVVTLTATADEGYELYTYIVKRDDGTEIEVEKKEDGITSTFFMPAYENVTVTAVFVRAGNHNVNFSNSEHGSLGAIKTSVAADDEVELITKPDDDYQLDSLSVKDIIGKDVTVRDNKFIMPNCDVTVTAAFVKIPRYTVTIASDNFTNGSVIATPNTDILKGTNIALTATADEGYKFYQYIVKDAAGNAITVENNAFTMPDSDVTVSAVFSSNGTHSITIAETENGVVSSGSSSVTTGTTVVLTFSPNTSYKLSSCTVKDAADNVITVTENSFIMPDSNVTVYASFKLITHTVTIDAKNGSEATSTTIVNGDTVAQPTEPTRDYYTFGGWYAGDTVYNFETPVTSDLTITAKWIPISYTITYDLNDNTATLDSEAKENYTVEEYVYLYPAKLSGKNFTGWYIYNANTEKYERMGNLPVGSHGDISLLASWNSEIFKIEFEQETITAYANSEIELNAKIYPDEAANLNLTWESSDDSHLTVEKDSSDNTKAVISTKNCETETDVTVTVKTTTGLTDTITVHMLPNNTNLKSVKYRTSIAGTAKDFVIDSGIKNDSSVNDTIYLDLVPDSEAATVNYRLSESNDWAALTSTTAIPLALGYNTVYVQVVAGDSQTTAESQFKIESYFRQIENFEMTSPAYSGGTINATFTPYSDSRVQTANGGILVRVNRNGMYLSEKSNANIGKVVDYLKDFTGDYTATQIKEIIASAKNYTASAWNELDQWIKLPGSAIGTNTGSFTIQNLETRAYYAVDVWAYTDGGNTFARILKTSVNQNYKLPGLTTAKSTKTKVSFWMHNLEAYKDHDGSTIPDYYFSFAASGENGGWLEPNGLDVGSPGKEMSDDSDKGKKYYNFGNSSLTGTEQAYGSAYSKLYSTEFSTSTSHSFTVTANVTDYDKSSGDDKIGDVTMTCTYNPDTDQWTLSWSGSNTTSGSKTVGYGTSRQDGTWEIHNTDDGEVNIHWGFTWHNVNN